MGGYNQYQYLRFTAMCLVTQLTREHDNTPQIQEYVSRADSVLEKMRRSLESAARCSTQPSDFLLAMVKPKTCFIQIFHNHAQNRTLALKSDSGSRVETLCVTSLEL